MKLTESRQTTGVYTPGSAGGRQTARVVRIALLCACDVGAITAAVVLAYAVWALPARGQPLSLYLQLLPLISLFVLGYAQAGLYPGFGLGPVETLRRLSYVTAFGFLVLAAFSFALKLPAVYSRATFAFAFAFSLLVVPAVRAMVFHWAGRHDWWGEPVVVIGTGERAARVIRNIHRASHFGYRPVAVLSPGGGDQPEVPDVEGVPVIGCLEQTASLAAEGVRVALVQTRRADPSRERSTVERLQQDFQHVVLVREYDDLPVEGLQIRNLGNLVGIEYTNNLLVHRNQVLKRLLDVTVASVALVIAAPIIALAALLVLVFDGGPVLFIQDRAGLGGRRIAVPKIRTMRRDAEAQLERALESDPELRREWEAHYKLKDDPRLIPVIGHVFRRFSIDELPQLWTVVTGEMSLVGPRPFPDYHLKQLSPQFLELRRRVRPGITGLWQITVRSAGGTAEQEGYDGYYIRNWSVWLDLSVLSRTIAAVASGRGAY